MQILAGALPCGVLNTGFEVVAVDQSPDGATLHFGDGSIAGPFDLVVGADGIKGVARKAMQGRGRPGRERGGKAGESSSGRGGAPGSKGAAEDKGAIYSGIRIQFGVATAGQRPKG